jgi:hypothetical protein
LLLGLGQLGLYLGDLLLDNLPAAQSSISRGNFMSGSESQCKPFDS